MEIGLAVGGAFLSSALNVLFDRLAPHGDLLNMFRKRKDHVKLLKKLEDILLGLQIVLSDAENKQASNRHVSQWLNKLQSAVDGAENLIEEVNYEALRLKVEGQHQNLAETSNKQVSDLNLCLTDEFFLNIKEKLEETIETLEVLEKQIGRLGLKDHFGSTKQETRTPSTSLVDDSGIFGRQNEIENLIDLLLSEDASGKKLTVVPIVGMGGLGKTALAKAVYHDERVKNRFGLKAWYCVSEPYDALRITKGLLQEIGSFDSKDVHNNLNQLQVKLKESLKGKKFLIVLDDVWNDNYNEWDDLRNLFVQGDTGSKIIVTTRKESVALMMGNEQISMDKLSTEASWSLFKRHAFENMDPMGHPELEEVGKQIAAKCKGLPLALKTLAGMLRSKLEVEEWKRILRSEIWELRDKDILPALMLSYNDLPAHLKRCFSFCAIFPKDYPFRKEQVIHLWIANGLVPQEDEIIEDSGNQYFLELRSRSLFERVPNPSVGNIENSFLMHDLVNDLAQIASSKLCIRLEESQGSHMLEKSRHLSYSMGEGGDFEKLTPLYKLEQLRTLLPTCISVNYCNHPLSKRVLHNILPRLRSLRVLSLSHYNIKELPNDLFIKLKLLRFLDISQTQIKRLPDSICLLYNLETLLLSSCEDLKELPLQMEKLINLRHLDISNTCRLKMPLHLSKLKSLQVLVISEMEIGLAVGGAFLSSALNVLFDRLAPQGDLLNMFRKHTDDVQLFEKLGDILLGLQIVLSDAENKQASNRHVSQWLNKLQSAVDGAENLIEEVNYEALRLKVEGQHQNLAEVSDLNLCLSDDFFRNIKDKLEETIETLEVLEKQIGYLGLKKHFGSTKQETRTPSTSLVDESDIFGRQSETEDLIDRLLFEDASGKNLAVVPIVGMGGVGKTTLAKVVYNDERVKNHFSLKAWFCVSEAYDAFRITKGLLQEIGSFDLKADDNLNQLLVKLKESLKGKKFLIVLDDVWNDNYDEWDDLINLFLHGDIGSKIIVTTRKESVALMMGSGAIYMGILSREDSWALFKRHSLENRDPKEHPEFEEVGKQIADKCKGLPLALKALAGILHRKYKVDEWRDILRSDKWERSICSNVIPVLMLSYNDLPAHLKQCFAYCAIYPKDYLFCKDQVIHLWIANGLVQQLDSGNQYFLELRSRSLFERVPESEWKPEGFLMHDLVNDLAQIASSNLCIRLEENKGSHMLEQCRHMSYYMGKDGDFEKLKSLFKSEQLRTLLPINIQVHYPYKLSKRVLHNILPRLRSLRALSLSRYQIKELPNDLFIKLKFLRFLDLSWTEIKKLPDSICALYNLETFLLSSCYKLEELPLQMEKLINLCHLDISNTSLLKMPVHLSKLKSLQVLVGAKFLLNWRMEDLGEVHNLYGSLSVVELQNVVDRREAVKAKMREKNHVEQLSLEWSESSSAGNSQTERDILDELHPHKNIKEVEITGYRGTKFPNWLADPLFLKLVKLSLSYCKDCYSLPALGQLPCLKTLSIKGMHGITKVTEEFYGSWSSKKPFNCLERLEFVDMPEWKQWHVLGSGEFPILEDLSIRKCPELSLETPIQLSSLKSFEVSGCPKVGVVFDDAQLFRSKLEGMKQIEVLYIRDCNSVTSFPFSILPTTLKRIEISGCRKLKLEAPVGEMSMFLEDLTLAKCGCIDYISPELLPRARTLNVDCHNLTRFFIPTATETLNIWNGANVEKLSVACGGTQMTSLTIGGCWKLKWLPERMQELLPSLNELYLSNCPEIESFPEGGLPFNLQLLEINNCKKLVNGRKEWCLQRLPCLTELSIYHDGSDEEIVGGENWEFPSSIQRLEVYNLKTLCNQHLKNLTSLQYLCIVGNLPQIQSMPSFSHLTSLQSLKIRKLPNLQSLPDSALPSSLSELEISHCPNLQSLPVKGMPSSLSELTIYDCPNLQSLPVKGMASSLSKLSISKCPLLRPLLEFDKEEYWPKIAHITIEIDQECM